jgi:hypothetical protein
VDALTDDMFEGGETPWFDVGLVLPEYAGVFDGVAITLNVMQWDKNNPRVRDLQLFGSNRTPFHQVEFRGDKALIRSNYEQLPSHHPERYNLGFGFTDPAKKLTPRQLEQIVKIKFLNGESNFTREEARVLEAWIGAQGKKRMTDLFENHILPGLPDKVTTYNSDSTLKKLFTI